MRRSMRPMLSAFAIAVAVAMTAGAAEAKCKRMGFLVNDYGKEGPANDAKRLLDDHIAKWAAENGIAKYTVGKKDVSCELYLDLLIFDEYTCTASANVCWDEGGSSGTSSSATPVKTPAASTAAPAEKPSSEASKPAEKKENKDSAEASKSEGPSTGEAKSSEIETGAVPAATPVQPVDTDAAEKAAAAAERAAAAAERAAAAAERAARAASDTERAKSEPSQLELPAYGAGTSEPAGTTSTPPAAVAPVTPQEPKS